MRQVGVGYRRPLHDWLSSRPPEVEFLEFTAEHFFDGGIKTARSFRERLPCAVHGLGLSLGTPGLLDRQTLRQFAKVSRAIDPLWVSEHVSFTKTRDVDLGHLSPIAATFENAATVAANAKRVMELTEKPLLLENITSHLLLPGEMTEPEFLNLICELSDAGLLLDVTNLFVNAKNHRFDPWEYFSKLEHKRVRQLHIVGYATDGEGRLQDNHSDPIQEDLMEFTLQVLKAVPVAAVVIERDARFPHPNSLAAELHRLKHDA